MNTQFYKSGPSYHYWGTLIGPNNLPIMHGATVAKSGHGGYIWTAKPEGRNMAIRVRKSGTSKIVPNNKVPDYVMAHIAQAIAIQD